ncbi:hypothetical protein I7856_12675 [Pseudomonas tolaasii]|nr:hypothetical protein [Pseudomonas tolaasii]MBW4793191.1 hypothetical protein [Pseudomonas tolaasii]
MKMANPDELRRDLRGIASDLKWSAVELVRIADRLSQAGNEPDAQAIIRMISIFENDQARLEGYAGEAAAGHIKRASVID